MWLGAFSRSKLTEPGAACGRNRVSSTGQLRQQSREVDKGGGGSTIHLR